VEDADEEESLEEGVDRGGHNLRGRQRHATYTPNSHMFKFEHGGDGTGKGDAHLNIDDDLLSTFHEPLGELFMTEQMSRNLEKMVQTRWSKS
jgi:hypothetical protein